MLAAATGLALAGGGGSARADLVEVIAAARPSIVPVGTYSETANPRFGFRGTGFVVGDGQLVATNFHVLPPDMAGDSGPQLAVLADRTPTGGQLRRARVVASDRAHDLALLRIDGAPLPALALAEAGSAREGQAIALIGFPIGGTLGFAPVTHRGIVASITTVALPAPTAGQLDARAIARLREGNFEVFQLDATAYPGNSGGPVLDVASGRVLAIVNMVLVRGSRESALANPTGITYAIPVRHLHELLRQAGR
ncbi:MAG: trypsin-like peptidase domain-containing protein [Rubrivivax sp.]|nr:trypsin-like peptidase domain-containing protein [Rubrivivax sp.]